MKDACTDRSRSLIAYLTSQQMWGQTRRLGFAEADENYRDAASGQHLDTERTGGLDQLVSMRMPISRSATGSVLACQQHSAG